MDGGDGGIRTLDTLLTYTHFPGVRFRPLSHVSKAAYYTQKTIICHEFWYFFWYQPSAL